VLWGALPKKERSGGFREGLAAGLSLVALDAFLRMAGFDKVLPGLIAMELAVIWAGFIWTRISWLGKSFHRSPLVRIAWSILLFQPTLKRDR
jgi:hypothetical protein